MTARSTDCSRSPSGCPTVLAPKTIDNDLGLNYPSEPDEWARTKSGDGANGYHYSRMPSSAVFDLNHIVNYVTPGYATAVLVSAQGVERIRTTAESHRRIAIIEVMGRHSGYIALGTAYGQPDIILVPEHPLDINLLVDRVRQLYDLQKNVVIVCGEGIVDAQGVELGDESKSTDPAGNVVLSGAAEALRAKMIQTLGDRYFQDYRRGSTAREAIFTRKVGHTQRGGRPILFDRFYAALLGSKAVDLLLEGRNNSVSVLQYNADAGFHVEGYDANRFRDRWGLIHARQMHPALYDPQADEAVEARQRIPATNLQRRHRLRRCRAHAPDALRRRQSVAAVSLDQHGRAQADPLSRQPTAADRGVPWTCRSSPPRGNRRPVPPPSVTRDAFGRRPCVTVRHAPPTKDWTPRTACRRRLH